jgi:hypothetical protein
MVAAGIERMRDLSCEDDRAYVAEAIYLAMEYQRLESLGKLKSFRDHGLQVSDS